MVVEGIDRAQGATVNFFSQTLRVTHANMLKTPILPPILHLKLAHNGTMTSRKTSWSAHTGS